jgi:hypothetical protein
LALRFSSGTRWPIIRLVRELSPKPGGLLGEQDLAPELDSSERRRACAKPASDDGDVCPEYLHRTPQISGAGGRVIDPRKKLPQGLGRLLPEQ